MKYSFYEIISTNKSDDNKLNKLKERCLDPGNYNKHLKRWLKEFPSKNIFLIDSDLFIKKPYQYLNRLQKFLNLKIFIDYSKKLVYDEKKSFFCINNDNSSIKKNKCLGAGKGRKYADIDNKSIEFLNEFNLESNRRLKITLQKYDFEIPNWL